MRPALAFPHHLPPRSVSWAGVFWVLLSELFSMSAKSPAASAATAVLFLTGVCSSCCRACALWIGPRFVCCRGWAAVMRRLTQYSLHPSTLSTPRRHLPARRSGG